jgi:hypothetical protein
MNPPSPQTRRFPAPHATLRLAASTLALLASLPASGQTQSLSFTGGILFNPRIELRNLGHQQPSPAAGPASGGAVNRTYSDGFNRVDASGNAEGSTGFWSFLNPDQISGDQLVLSAPGGASTVHIDNAGSLFNPSGNLEYRGSFGAAHEADWGVLLAVGYQSLSAEADGAFVTEAWILEDRFELQGLTPSDLPAPPYAGAADTKTPRIGATPTRTLRPIPGGRSLSGRWEFDAVLIPISGGIYIESQIFGRLNGVASAGMFAAFVNANLKYTETTTFAGSAPVTVRGGEGGNDVILGGFVQLGLDWALWEDASLVASARWQPAQDYAHAIAGREARVDFMTAAAVHLGFSLRF